MHIRQIKLGIFDYENAYVCSLMNYINADKRNPIFAIAFSSKQNLLDYLSENELEMLLISEDSLADEELADNLTDLNIIRLTDEDRGQAGYGYIYKYSKAELIQSRIVKAYKALETDLKNEFYQTFAIISPIGRSGKTGLSKAICSLDEVRGGIYIGMEAYGGYDEEGSNVHNMSDIAYLIKIRSEELIRYLEEYVVSEDKFGKILSPKTYLDIRELDRKDMRWFIEWLIKWGRYTSIVFDIDGAALGDISILSLFDHVIVPVSDDAVSQNKLKNFIQLLNDNELGKVAERLKTVQVPDALYNSTEMLICAGRLLEN